MDKFPLYLDAVPVGELTVTRQGLYTCFQVECALAQPALCRAFAVGESGRLRLGVVEPLGAGTFGICRKLPTRDCAAAGRLTKGELERCGQQTVPEPDRPAARWRPEPHPERLFRSDFLKEQLRFARGVLVSRRGAVQLIALPFDSRRPFLMTALFCFARVCTIGTNLYAVFAFDRDERPVFSGEEK